MRRLQEAVDAAAAGDVLTVKGTCVGNTTVSKDLTILGKNKKATLDGNGSGTVLTVVPTIVWPPPDVPDLTVTVDSLTITNGVTGIRRFLADMNISNSIVSENSGRGINAVGDNWTPGGVLTLVNSTVTGNSDGGIVNGAFGSVVVLIDSSVTGNTTTGCGGGIATGDGVALFGNSTVTGNTAATGGGVCVGGDYLGSLSLNDTSSVTNNSADYGGGIYVGLNAQVTLNDSSSVAYNTAQIDGGGIYNSRGHLTLNSGTVTNNDPNDIVNAP